MIINSTLAYSVIFISVVILFFLIYKIKKEKDEVFDCKFLISFFLVFFDN